MILFPMKQTRISSRASPLSDCRERAESEECRAASLSLAHGKSFIRVETSKFGGGAITR